MDPVEVIDQLMTLLRSNGVEIGQRLLPGAQLILAATVAIRLIQLWFQAMFEDSIAEVIGETLNVVVLSQIMLLAMRNVAGISDVLWQAADELMTVMNPSMGGTAAFANKMWSVAVETVSRVWEFVFTIGQSEQSQSLLDKIADAVTGVLMIIVNMGAAGLVSALFVVYFLILLLQLFVAVMRLTVTTALFPIAAAFAPIFDNWIKNFISSAAAAIAYLGVLAMLSGLTIDLVVNLSNDLEAATSTLQFPASQGGFLKLVGLAMVGVLVFLLGLATGQTLRIAAALFGGVGGMIGSLAAGRGGGGGGATGGGSASGGGSPPPSGGGVRGAAAAAGRAAGAGGGATLRGMRAFTSSTLRGG